MEDTPVGSDLSRNERDTALRMIDEHIARSPIETAGAGTYADLDARRNARRERLISLADAYAEIDHAWPDAARLAIEHERREWPVVVAQPVARDAGHTRAQALFCAAASGSLLGTVGMAAVFGSVSRYWEATALFGAVCGAASGLWVGYRRQSASLSAARGAALFVGAAITMQILYSLGTGYPYQLGRSALPAAGYALVGAVCGAGASLVARLFGPPEGRAG